jgi:16S rRNA (uracil1498-N3)-methyltransferase
MPYFYCPELDGSIEKVTVSNDEFHHLVHVLRHKPGDEINLNSGTGWLAEGIIDSVGRNTASVFVRESIFTEPPPVSYAIAFSLLRNRNDEWLVEKATELGVKNLFPLSSVNSVRNPSANTIIRFQKSALSAIKQCGNPYLPAIHDILNLEQLLLVIKQSGYTAVTASEHRPDWWLDSLQKGVSYCFIVGPEGGFSPDEFDFLRKCGVVEICVSKLILRAETAALAAASQFSLLNK